MKYRFFMVSRHGYKYVAAVTADTLQEACRAHIKAWHARASSCAVIMRCLMASGTATTTRWGWRMAERLTMSLYNAQQAHQAITNIYNTAKPSW